MTKRRPPTYKREAYWRNYRLFPWEVPVIRYLRESEGWTHVEIAKMYGITDGHSCNIVAHRRWADIDTHGELHHHV